MTAIAARAGLPVGTIYQFFDGKDAVVHALAERFAEGFEPVLDGLLPRLARTHDWRASLRRLLRAYPEYHRTAPALRPLWVGARVPLARLAVMLLCAWEAGQALLETAFRRDPDGDRRILSEAHRLLERYLAPAFER